MWHQQPHVGPSPAIICQIPNVTPAAGMLRQLSYLLLSSAAPEKTGLNPLCACLFSGLCGATGLSVSRTWTKVHAPHPVHSCSECSIFSTLGLLFAPPSDLKVGWTDFPQCLSRLLAPPPV